MTLAAFSSFWMRFRVIAPRMFFCSRAIAFCSWALELKSTGLCKKKMGQRKLNQLVDHPFHTYNDD
jgi:hypothetical protein